MLYIYIYMCVCVCVEYIYIYIYMYIYIYVGCVVSPLHFRTVVLIIVEPGTDFETHRKFINPGNVLLINP